MPDLITVNSPFRSSPRISREGFVRVLARTGSFESDPLWMPTDRERRDIDARRIYDYIADHGHDPAVHLAIAGKEHTFGTNQNSVLWRNDTRSWTNARSIRHPEIEGGIITDEQRGSQYVRYKTAMDSIRDGVYRVDDPNYAYADAHTIADVIAVWAPSDDQNDPDGYARTMVRWINEWADEFPVEEEPDMLPVEEIGRRVEAFGVRFEMIADQLTNTGQAMDVPLDWEHLAVHHSASRMVEPNVEVEIERWKRHAEYHVNSNGWPRIGYTWGISPSGTLYGLARATTRGYHAYDANASAVAVCLDGALHQENPTPEMLYTLNAFFHVVMMADELSVDRGDIWGHREFTFIDSRNASTTCPSDIIVQQLEQFRGGSDFVDLYSSSDTGACTYFDSTGHYICHGFRGYWRDNGGVEIFGYPLSEEFDRDGMTVQWFERARFEYQPDIADNEHGAVLGRVGAESRKQDEQDYPEAFEKRDPPN